MDKGKELAKNTAIISLGKICTQFLSFLLLPLYTAVLSTSEYGVVDLLMTYQQLIVCTVFCQVEQAVFRYLIEVRGDGRKSSEIISSCMFFSLLQAIILGIIFLIVKISSGYKYSSWLYLYVVAVMLSGFVLQISRGFGDNVTYALGSFLSAISTILFNILFLVVLKFNIQGMLLSYILGNLICITFISFRLRIYQYIRISKIQIPSLKRCLKYSIPLVPNALSWWVMSASDRSIVAAVLGTSYNGLLTVAHKFPSAYSTFYTVFNLSWTEAASLHIEDKDADIFFGNVISRVYRLFVALAIGIIACMPFAFRWLVHTNYSEAYYQIPIYMISAVCQVFQGLYSVIYVAKKNTKEVAKSTVVSAVINVISHLLLINYIGLYAASISTLLSYLFLCVWRYFDLKKYMDCRFDMRLLLSSVVMMIIVCLSYYIRNRIGCVFSLVVTILYCIFINRDILRAVISNPKGFKRYMTHSK